MMPGTCSASIVNGHLSVSDYSTFQPLDMMSGTCSATPVYGLMAIADYAFA